MREWLAAAIGVISRRRRAVAVYAALTLLTNVAGIASRQVAYPVLAVDLVADAALLVVFVSDLAARPLSAGSIPGFVVGLLRVGAVLLVVYVGLVASAFALALPLNVVRASFGSPAGPVSTSVTFHGSALP